MTRRSQQVALGAAVALLAVAGVTSYLRSQGAARLRRTAQVEHTLQEAHALVAAARTAEILDLAPEDFGRVEAGIAASRERLRVGELDEAGRQADAALDLARKATDEARGRSPIARAAVLRALTNKVMYRSAQGVAWSDAEEAMSLFDHDRLSTKERSRAIVRFDEGSEMRVEENSVMVIERIRESRVSPTLAMTLSVPEGSVRSLVSRENNRDVRLEINLPRAGIVVDTAKEAGGKIDFGTRVQPDQSNRVSVYTGQAEVQGAGGERIVLKQNQYAEVTAEGKVLEPKELPTSAIMLLPGRNATVYTSSHRPDVTFKWKASGNCAQYRLEVSRGVDFLDLVVDESVGRPSFTYGNLAPGKYVWRIACVDDHGVMGAYTETSTFQVVLDDRAPQLAVLAPAANVVVADASIQARCRVDGDTTVFINGEEAVAGKDRVYQRTVPLSVGLNTLVFEAVDASGNVVYNSRLVTRRP